MEQPVFDVRAPEKEVGYEPKTRLSVVVPSAPKL